MPFLPSISSSYGGYTTSQIFVHGLIPALWIDAGVVALGAVAAFLIPPREAPAQVIELGLAFEVAG